MYPAWVSAKLGVVLMFLALKVKVCFFEIIRFKKPLPKNQEKLFFSKKRISFSNILRGFQDWVMLIRVSEHLITKFEVVYYIIYA